MTKYASNIVCLIKLFMVGLILSPALVWGAFPDHLGLLEGSSVEKQVINKGAGYEVKNVTYQDSEGNNRGIELIFINNAKGAINAHKEIGLPAVERDEVVENFERRKTQKITPKLNKKTIGNINGIDDFSPTQGPVKSPVKGLDEELVVIDKEIAFATSNSEIEAILLSRGMSQQELNALANTQARGWSCWRDKQKEWDKTFNENIGETFGLGNGASISINTTVEGDAKAELDYSFKKAFWCSIPYKVRLNKLAFRADYKLFGGLNIIGKVSKKIKGVTWPIAEPTLASGTFFVGFIPVVYNVTVPITAGTGDLEVEVSAEVDIDKTIDITGHYEYGCTNGHCAKVSSSIESNNSVNSSTVQLGLSASVKIEPWAKVAVAGDIYWGFLEAEVGVKPSFPVMLKGYAGNTCSDGDGLNGNENVEAGIIDIYFRLGIEASAGALWNALDTGNQYWQLYRKNLYFKDLIRPYSSAFSPVIRPSSIGTQVTMPVSLRSCMNSFLDTSRQDFIIDWGNGETTPINNLSGTKVFRHSYAQPGTYEISVAHNNGASTKKPISLTAPSGYVDREFRGSFPWFDVQGGYFGGWPRKTVTNTFCLPEAIARDCEINTSKTHSTYTNEGPLYGRGGPGFGIYITTVNSPGGAQNASYSLNSATGCLTSTVTVRAKRRMRGWYKGEHVIYARCPF